MTDMHMENLGNPDEFVAGGADWDDIVTAARQRADDTIVVNMGPQHPSTHGVLRLVLELDGETVIGARPGIGFLHSGIEKTTEFRSWTQACVLLTRTSYVAGMHNEAVYSLAVDKLLGITAEMPARANALRVLMMEVNRIASHLTAVGACGLELGATSVQEVCLRERERVLEFTEAVTGLRMNNAYIRPGGVAVDLPVNGVDLIRELVKQLRKNLPEIGDFTVENPIFKARLQGVGYMSLAQCMSLGMSGPVLRSTGYPWDLRKTQPYCDYETYDFDVCTADTCDSYGRWVIRLNEMEESVKIIEQCAVKLEATAGQPYRIEDARLAATSDLTVAADGQGNSLAHVKHIMGDSMEGLIHHFKRNTQGFTVPPGQVYQTIESPSGELGCHVVSDGGARPYRVHMRDAGFNALQAVPMVCEGGMLSDAVVALGSLDTVMGGVDR